MTRKGRGIRKDCKELGFERLDNKILLSSNPWYIDSIKAPEVWASQSAVDNRPIVAIIDSGVDLNHPDLVPNLFHNRFDPIDGIDNDKNGLVDDYTGWNFANYNNIPQDNFYHGTHVAGIVNAIGHGNVRILPIKCIGDTGSGYVGSIVAGINYAITLKNQGYNITAINCSFGSLLNNNWGLDNAIKNASDNGIIVVMAAGNNGSDLDIVPRYPGSLSYANTITVAGINSDNSLAGYSNYGVKTVAVAAPATSIYSTLPRGTYGYVSGTSMAAPMVSGGVALLKSFGNYAASSLLTAIKGGANMISSLVDKVSNGLLDLASSLRVLKTQPVIAAPIPPKPVVPPAPVVPKLDYKVVVSDYVIKGWVNTVNGKISTPVVQVYVNNVLRYSVKANLYRGDTKQNNGFYIVINRKFLTLKNNLIEVRINDSLNNLTSTVYKSYITR